MPMGSSSCCRPPTTYQPKVLSLGLDSCLSCGRCASSTTSLTVLLQVDEERPRRSAQSRQTNLTRSQNQPPFVLPTSRRPMLQVSDLYNPLKAEHHHHHHNNSFCYLPNQSRSVCHGPEVDYPVHVRLKPSDEPTVSHGSTPSDRRHSPGHLDSCIRAPPNRNPFSSIVASSSSPSPSSAAAFHHSKSASIASGGVQEPHKPSLHAKDYCNYSYHN